MVRTILAALALVFTAPLAQAQDLTPEELHDCAIHRRAVEAVTWGMPAVDFDRMLQAAIANGAVIYWSRPVNWQNQTLTPNPDTICAGAQFGRDNIELIAIAATGARTPPIWRRYSS